MPEDIVDKRAKGGHARAESLTASERTNIAKKAASARWDKDIPKAGYSGTLRIGGSEIPCAVFEDGDEVRRVIVQREVVGLLTGNKKGNLDRYLSAKNLEPFVPEKFKNQNLSETSIVLDINGRKAYCYEGEDIVDICNMYLRARKQRGVLLQNQLQLADRAEIVITALAKTGIQGLIDEATGYQQVRSRDALQAYLDRILRKELAAWVQRFPNEFFQEMHRLKGWKWSTSMRRPMVAGKYVKDIVYDRLGPGITDELENKNPSNKGRRAAKHHQWLTEDVGHPALAQHLYAVIGLMRMSATWPDFMSFLNRAYPKRDNKQLALKM